MSNAMAANQSAPPRIDANKADNSSPIGVLDFEEPIRALRGVIHLHTLLTMEYHTADETLDAEAISILLERAKREGDTLQELFEGYCRQQREGRATSKAS